MRAKSVDRGKLDAALTECWMEILYSDTFQCGGYQPQVAIKDLKCGQCN